MNIYAALALVWTHWLADFVMQSDKMAKGKSKSNFWLAFHVLVYSAFLLPWGWRFAAINGIAHFCTDWLSSRATSKLWQKGKVHDFFVIIGLDQAIHLTTLLLTWHYLKS